MSESTTPAVASETAPPQAVNFDEMPLGDLRSQILAGVDDSFLGGPGTAPAAEPEPSAEEPPAEEPETTPQEDKTAEEPAAEETPAEESPAETVEFKFTEDADDETFARETAQYLESVEVTPELQLILDRQTAKINELSTQAEQYAPFVEDELATRTVNALNKLVDFRQNEQGEFIPDTTELTRLLSESYAKELPQVVQDLCSLPSQKYQGLTMYQEFLKDWGGLDDRGMMELEAFLDNKGRVPTPTFVPTGINQKFAEAFWNSPDREAIEEFVAQQVAIVNNQFETPENRNMAQAALNQINTRLMQVQNGLDADKANREREAQTKLNTQRQLQTKAEANYLETSVGLLRDFTNKVSATLTMFDEKGASVTALGLTTLIEKALTNDAWAKYAQEDLAKQGITFDWGRGRQALDRLWDIEAKLVVQEQTPGLNPRAIENSRKEKANILKDIKALETELMGKVSKIAISGAAKQLEKKTAVQPKTKAVRPAPPKAGESAPAAPAPGKQDAEMSPEELRSRMGELRNLARQHGIQLS